MVSPKLFVVLQRAMALSTNLREAWAKMPDGSACVWWTTSLKPDDVISQGSPASSARHLIVRHRSVLVASGRRARFHPLEFSRQMHSAGSTVTLTIIRDKRERELDECVGHSESFAAGRLERRSDLRFFTLSEERCGFTALTNVHRYRERP